MAKPKYIPSVVTDVYVSVVQAAYLAGLHPHTLWRRARAGKLTLYGVARTSRVKLTDVLPKRDLN